MNKLKYRLMIRTKLKGFWRSLLLRLIMNKSQWKAYKSWMNHANPSRLGEEISLMYNRQNKCYYVTMHEIHEQATSSSVYPVKNYKLNLHDIPDSQGTNSGGLISKVDYASSESVRSSNPISE